jgi:uncharacterized protein involved in type VI secretion and phage assembly
MKKLLCCVLSFIILNGQAFAQSSAKAEAKAIAKAEAKAKKEEAISEAQIMMQETAQATQQATEEDYDSNLNPQQRFEESPKHNVHNYNYKQQVVVGGSVMFCIILAMVANNNYNPKGIKK